YGGHAEIVIGANAKQNGRNPDPFDESAFRPSDAAGRAARRHVMRPYARR
ncbi:hypothetical protein B1M_35866, partial [Burkholderia sp. TJI49]